MQPSFMGEIAQKGIRKEENPLGSNPWHNGYYSCLTLYSIKSYSIQTIFQGFFKFKKATSEVSYRKEF